jgi:hypothetical protein
MTNRILKTLKTFALGVAMRASAKRLCVEADTSVEPRIRSLGASPAMAGFDDWMFDKSTPFVSQQAHALSQDMSRVSGALSGLRAVLGSISAHAATLDTPAVEFPHAPLLMDDGLFDGEPMAASYGGIPEAHAELFVEQAEEDFRQVA